MNLKLFQQRNLLLTFFFSFCFSVSLFANTEGDICNCEEDLCNPNCIKVCQLKLPLQEIKSRIIKNCFGANRSYYFEQDKVKATKALELINKSKEEIMELAEGSEKSLKKKCPDCEKIYKISSKFDFKPEQKTCGEEYLKTYSYKTSTAINLNKGEHCNIGAILTYFESYTLYLVAKRGDLTKDPFKEMSKEDRSLITSRSKELWANCPAKCSFLTSYSTKINPEKCKGEVDIKVDCTHKVSKKFFTPIYDVKISYEPDLQCKELNL